MRRIRTILLAGVLCLVALQPAHSQSNEIIDVLLEQEWASFAETAHLVMSGAGLIPDDLPMTALMDILVQRRWISNPNRFNQPITVAEYAYLMMEAFEVPHGLLYGVFPTGWFGVREINFLQLLPDTKKAQQFLLPFEVLYGIQRIMEWEEAHNS